MENPKCPEESERKGYSYPSHLTLNEMSTFFKGTISKKRKACFPSITFFVQLKNQPFQALENGILLGSVFPQCFQAVLLDMASQLPLAQLRSLERNHRPTTGVFFFWARRMWSGQFLVIDLDGLIVVYGCFRK